MMTGRPRIRTASRTMKKKNPPVTATIAATTAGSTVARTPGNVGRIGGGMTQRIEDAPVGVPGEDRRDDDVDAGAHELAGVEPADHREPIVLGGQAGMLRGRRFGHADDPGSTASQLDRGERVAQFADSAACVETT